MAQKLKLTLVEKTRKARKTRRARKTKRTKKTRRTKKIKTKKTRLEMMPKKDGLQLHQNFLIT